MSLEQYPAVRTRLRKDALALKRRIDTLCRAMAAKGIVSDVIVAQFAHDAERLANCIAADCRAIDAVADSRLNKRQRAQSGGAA